MDMRYVQLKDELKKAISVHYQRLVKEVPDVYGYALLTEDGVSSIKPVANRSSAIKVDPDDPMYRYYRYGAVEWSEWDDFGLFESVNAFITELPEDESLEFADKRADILRQAVEALCELEASGLFGPRSANRFVVLCISDSDDPIMAESVRRLNSAEVYEAYASEFSG